MKKINLRNLLTSVLIFSGISFLVHTILNPELSVWGNIGYALFSGLLFGVFFYFFDQKRK
jgi:hypothetical protein